MIIYKITHKLSGKCYIGQTVQNLKKRWVIHTATKSGCPYLSNALDKYGKEAFSIEEIASYKNMEDLNNAEEYFIDYYNCLAPHGYNIQSGGNSFGKMHPETKLKISQATKGKKKSLQMRQKLSASKMGAKHPMYQKPAKNRTPIKCLNNGIIYSSQEEASIALNCSITGINMAVRKVRPHTKGYRFEYIEVSNGR